MPSVFTKIVNGELPAHKIYEDEKYLAFLSINPIQPGHIVIIPKQEIDYMFDVKDGLYAGLFLLAKKLSKPLQKATGAKKIGIIVAGWEVPHAHINLIPMNSSEELDMKLAKPATPEELSQMADKIKQAME